jgi:hypothetical protein
LRAMKENRGLNRGNDFECEGLQKRQRWARKSVFRIGYLAEAQVLIYMSQTQRGYESVRAFPVFVINARGSDGQLLNGFRSVGPRSGHDVGYKEEISKGGGWTPKSS